MPLAQRALEPRPNLVVDAELLDLARPVDVRLRVAAVGRARRRLLEQLQRRRQLGDELAPLRALEGAHATVQRPHLQDGLLERAAQRDGSLHRERHRALRPRARELALPPRRVSRVAQRELQLEPGVARQKVGTQLCLATAGGTDHPKHQHEHAAASAQAGPLVCRVQLVALHDQHRELRDGGNERQ